MNAIAQPTKMNPAETITADLVTYDVRDLISKGVQARLVLDGQPYFLRITRAGKLILTK